MIITCQQCNTNYDVDAKLIGDGKTVSCQNCSNTWFQNPVKNPPVFKYRSPMPSTSPLEHEKTYESPESSGIQSTDETRNEKNITEDEGLSSEALDDMFGEQTGTDDFFTDDDFTGDDSDTDIEGETDNTEDFESPEPIPGVFSQGSDQDEDDESPSGKGKKIAIISATIIATLCLALYFGQTFIMDMFGESQVGEGLDIQNVKSVRKDEKGVDFLIVKGIVANVSDEARKVPLIKVALYDGTEKEVYKKIIAPMRNSLKAGAKIRFSAKLAKPSASARRMEVTFTKPKEK